MNYYHATFIEQNGEQEYSYDYLVEADTIFEANAKLQGFLKGWYFDRDEDAEELSFNSGAQEVRAVNLVETTKEAFIIRMLDDFTVKD